MSNGTKSFQLNVLPEHCQCVSQVQLLPDTIISGHQRHKWNKQKTKQLSCVCFALMISLENIKIGVAR